jgi:hypothetical protein
MVELTQAVIDVARERGQRALVEEPRAIAARYDRARERIVVELSRGCEFAFPPGLAEGLGGATEEDLSSIEVLGHGSGLRWDRLDIDLHIPSLLVGVFGTRSWLARQGGATKSAAKSAAARTNGAKGGRPKKSSSVI